MSISWLFWVCVCAWYQLNWYKATLMCFMVQRQSSVKRMPPCTSCSRGEQTRQLNSVCRQTDTPGHSCVYLHMWMQYLQYSEVQERILTSVFICERGLRNGDERDSSDLSLPQVHEPECERWWTMPYLIESTWCDLSAKKTQTHTRSAGVKNTGLKIHHSEENLSPTRPRSNVSLPLSNICVSTQLK